ncbi:MAG TPA: amidohydrolase family protein [Thermoleophilaceae bacterium]
MNEDQFLEPWFDHIVASLPDVSLFDAHTHIGHNDPDGFTLSEEELVATLERAGSRAAATPMHEPDGYPAANDAVLEACERSGGRLVALCRVDPHRDPVTEARRCLDAGARGIKLHPRAEGFALSDPEVAPIFELAHEERLLVLVHAGRGIASLGRDGVDLARRYPEARIVLAHAAICDLNWLWHEIPRHPNLFIDTSWWNPSDLAALIALVPPGHLLYATDLPYFTPFMVAPMVTRYAYQLGLDDSQVAAILGGQAARILAGEEPLDLGPPAGQAGLDYDVRLERIGTMLNLAIGRMLMGRTGWEPLSLARLACDLGDPDAPESDVCRNVLALLEAQERLAKADPECSAPFGPGIRLVMLAACVARTPDVALPRTPGLEGADRLHAASQAGHRIVATARPEPVAQPARDIRRSSAADHLVLDPGSASGES